MDNNEIDRALHGYYEQRAPEYDEWYDRRGRYNNPVTNAAWYSEVGDLTRNVTRLAATVSHNTQARILDLACGTGKWTPIFGQALPETGRVIAFDYSSAMLAQTQARLTENEQNSALEARIRFVRGDAYALPFKNGAFDIVFFGFWLSHVPRERMGEFLTEVKRVLKPAGQVFMVDSAQELNVPNEEISKRPLNDGSIHQILKVRYSVPELQALLERYFGPGQASATQTRRYFVIGVASKQ